MEQGERSKNDLCVSITGVIWVSVALGGLTTGMAKVDVVGSIAVRIGGCGIIGGVGIYQLCDLYTREIRGRIRVVDVDVGVIVGITRVADTKLEIIP